MSNTDRSSVSTRRSAIRRVFGFVRNALALVGLLCIIYYSFFDLSKVVSPSMEPTLKGKGGPDSDWVLFEKVSYRFRQPRRWEVAQLLSKDNLLVAKRVVGLPGEIVSIVDKHAAVNGSVLPIPRSLTFLQYYPYGDLSKGRQASCGNGYFILGDDSRDSADSRYDGPVAPDHIRARAWLRVWPWSRIGSVNP